MTNSVKSEYTIAVIINHSVDNFFKVFKMFSRYEDTMEQEHPFWVSMIWGEEWI